MLSTTPTPTFHQLVALPMEEYNQMRNVTNMQQPPLNQKLIQLQRELSASASAPPPSAAAAAELSNNPYDRLMRQGMLLEEVKRTKEQLQNDISLGTPKPYRNRALALYNQIAPVTHFNEKGELVLPLDGGVTAEGASGDGRPIVGSRAEDLIQHAVRDRRKQFTPTGWPEFLAQLHKHNIPRMMLNRSTIDELQTLATKPLLLPAAAAAPAPTPPRRGKAAAAATVKAARHKRKRVRKPSAAALLRDFEP